MIDLLFHVLYTFLFIGQVLLSRQYPSGWLARLVANVGWVCLGFHMGLTSFWLWGILFLAIDVKGYLSWRTDASSET